MLSTCEVTAELNSSKVIERFWRFSEGERESCYGRKKGGSFAGGEGIKIGGEEDWRGYEDVGKEYGGDIVADGERALGDQKNRGAERKGNMEKLRGEGKKSKDEFSGRWMTEERRGQEERRRIDGERSMMDLAASGEQGESDEEEMVYGRLDRRREEREGEKLDVGRGVREDRREVSSGRGGFVAVRRSPEKTARVHSVGGENYEEGREGQRNTQQRLSMEPVLEGERLARGVGRLEVMERARRKV